MTEEEKKREEKYGIYYHEMNYGEVGRGLASLIQKLAGNEKKKKEQKITVVIRDTTSSKDRERIKELKTWTREEIIEGIRETEKNENQRWVVSGAKVVCTAMAGTKSSCSMIKLRGGIEVQGGLALSQKDITFKPLFTGCQNVDGNRCKPEIENEEWQEYDEGNSLGNGEFALLKEESYMFCLYGGGLLYITDDGQREPELESLIQEDRGEAEGSGKAISSQGIAMIANFELSEGSAKKWGIGEFDANGKMTGIYPHYVFKNIGTQDNPNWVTDGGITFGHGIYVTKSMYDSDSEIKKMVDKYAPGASFVPPSTPSNGVPYKVLNSIAMPTAIETPLYENKLKDYEDAVNNFLNKNNVTLKQNQFDALLSFTYNYGVNWWDKDKVMPNFIRDGKGVYDSDEVRRIFGMHDNPTRRLAEAEVFINGY